MRHKPSPATPCYSATPSRVAQSAAWSWAPARAGSPSSAASTRATRPTPPFSPNCCSLTSATTSPRFPTASASPSFPISTPTARWRAHAKTPTASTSTATGTPGWQPDTHGPSGLVPGAGGTRPFSEPETRALARYLVNRPFVAAIFIHSQGGVVVPGPGGGSVELASTIARAAQYIHLRGWTAYPLSGQSSKYLVQRGIHVAIVELTTHTHPDFPQNLQGLRAALAWAQDLPQPRRTSRYRRCRVLRGLRKLSGNLSRRADLPAMPLVTPTRSIAPRLQRRRRSFPSPGGEAGSAVPGRNR